jgi:enoyl-CoA hydratase/carnithine racemase
MTVDEVINDVFLKSGISPEHVKRVEEEAARVDPMTVEWGRNELTPEDEAHMRELMSKLLKLPKPVIAAMLKDCQALARRRSVVN